MGGAVWIKVEPEKGAKCGLVPANMEHLVVFCGVYGIEFYSVGTASVAIGQNTLHTSIASARFAPQLAHSVIPAGIPCNFTAQKTVGLSRGQR